MRASPANKITGANARGPRPLPIPARRAARIAQFVGADPPHRRQWAFERTDDVGDADRVCRAAKRPSTVTTAVTTQQARVAQLSEDVDQEAGRQLVAGSQLVARHRTSRLIAFRLGDHRHHPHPVVNLVGDAHAPDGTVQSTWEATRLAPLLHRWTRIARLPLELPAGSVRRQPTRWTCYDSAMRALLAVSVLAMTLAISACGDDDSSDDAATDETVAVNVPDVIGDSVEEATATLEEAGFTLRVVQRDGEDLPGTADFLENRVNVAVETQDDGTEVVTEVVSTG